VKERKVFADVKSRFNPFLKPNLILSRFKFLAQGNNESLWWGSNSTPDRQTSIASHTP